jgi:hypothetical protein
MAFVSRCVLVFVLCASLASVLQANQCKSTGKTKACPTQPTVQACVSKLKPVKVGSDWKIDVSSCFCASGTVSYISVQPGCSGDTTTVTNVDGKRTKAWVTLTPGLCTQTVCIYAYDKTYKPSPIPSAPKGSEYSKSDVCNLCVYSKIQVFLPKNAPCLDDKNACTQDVCDGKGQCGVVLTGPDAAKVCDDGNQCTTDTCDVTTKTCKSEATDCDDGNACTVDTCKKGKCKSVPKKCDDGKRCTTDKCDAKTGKCQFAPKKCDDYNPCTEDKCDPASGGCLHVAKQCATTDKCKAARCDKNSGSCREEQVVFCNDHDACTDDACDPATGKCVYTPNKSCECKADGDCNDSNECTEDKCVNFKCQRTPKAGAPCKADDNLCTTDTCNAAGACVAAPVTCSDPFSCTEDKCDPATGKCLSSPQDVLCNDDNLCTTEECKPSALGADVHTGCLRKPVVCNDGATCTNDLCNPKVGCQYIKQDSKCNSPGDLCTTGTCDPGVTGANKVTGCKLAKVTCDDGYACTKDECNKADGRCYYTPQDGYCNWQVKPKPICAESGDCGECNPARLISCDPEYFVKDTPSGCIYDREHECEDQGEQQPKP